MLKCANQARLRKVTDIKDLDATTVAKTCYICQVAVRRKRDLQSISRGGQR